MADLYGPTLDDCIVECEREYKLRCNYYPRWFAEGKIKKQDADWRLACMQLSVVLLKRLKELSDG